MTEEQTRKWIDGASYETLLRKWRFAGLGDPFFQGELGDYYSKVMFEKRRALEALGDGAVQASKNIGWETN